MSETRNQILERIERLDDLPAFSKSSLAIQKMFWGHQYDTVDETIVVHMIEKDIGLAAKVLKIANSIYFGSRYGRVGGIGQAVVRLGLEEIHKICMAISCMQLFPKASDLISLKSFWKHSVSVAMIARNLAKKSGNADLDDGVAYLAGLLHDIGILILDQYFYEVYRKIREATENFPGPIHELEKKLLDIDHGEIGGMILVRWRFPKNVVDAVSWHHAPDRSPDESLAVTQLVHIADFACSALGALEPGDAIPKGFSLGAWHDLKIDTNDIQRIVTEVEEEIDRTDIFLNMGA